ncbi:MAG: DUF2797 domain-containing protein, partial [Candidatus Kariarchaeaceae archaeon]
LPCNENQKQVNPKINETQYQSNPVFGTNIQCSLCRTTDYFACRKMCLGKVCMPSSLRAKAKCDPPNTSVYLTHVGGEIKVGVSLQLMNRWLEQGSDYATEIVNLPGLEARKLEQEASKTFNLKLQVRNQTKLRNIDPVPFEEGFEELSRKLVAMQPLIDLELINTKGHKPNKNEIHNLTEFYGNLSYDRYIDVIDPHPDVEYGGIIESIKGSLIIVKQGKFYYAIDTKKFHSYIFEFLDRRAKIKKEQAALDEWF